MGKTMISRRRNVLERAVRVCGINDVVRYLFGASRLSDHR
jgi:hypothetical protein